MNKKHPITSWQLAPPKSPHAIMTSVKGFTKTSSILRHLWWVASLTDPSLKCQAALRFDKSPPLRLILFVTQIRNLDWVTNLQPFCSSVSVERWTLILGKITYFSHSSLPPVSPLFARGGSYHLSSGQSGHRGHNQQQRSMNQSRQHVKHNREKETNWKSIYYMQTSLKCSLHDGEWWGQ